MAGFNTQPPEGGWAETAAATEEINIVSTHSRPKAAGMGKLAEYGKIVVSTHSRPKAAGL